ncbi:MAG: acyl-CoA carboxylase subunit beta [Candidatus Latescibacteria bacterium]|nr:acyl-CoA carboxylase subunit beta [Candidatus Latescibacterota bacterium]
MVERVVEIHKAQRQIHLGGGEANIEKQHAKGRLTARERVELLIDEGSRFYELGEFAAWDMYKEWGGAPAAGSVCGLGSVEGRLAMIIANDATVKAGAFFPMTAKKIIRCQYIAEQCHLPTIYLVDSAGIFLPLQEDVFPDQDDFGRIFYLNARMTSKGIPQITAIMGYCVAGGAYLPVMTDKILMTEGSGLYIGGPALVKAAIGQEVSHEELGGAWIHSAVSGTIDFREKDDPACLVRLRRLMAQIGEKPRAPFARAEPVEPRYDPDDLYGIFTDDLTRQYDMKEIIARIVDDSEFVEYRSDIGKTVLCGYSRIGGWSVGIVGNQRLHQKPAMGMPEVGGVIYPESAEKAARFIMDCNQNLIPLIFLHDVSGFMVGKDAEYDGIIRAGAKMVNVVSNSVVPKITVIVGGSYGAGNYAMAGKAYDPRFILAWPTARYAVMGGAQAANTLADIRVKSLEKRGEKLSDEEKQEILDTINAEYDRQTDSRYAAAHLWVDAIIDPRDTRDWLITALDAASHQPEIEKFNPGILQT